MIERGSGGIVNESSIIGPGTSGRRTTPPSSQACSGSRGPRKESLHAGTFGELTEDGPAVTVNTLPPPSWRPRWSMPYQRSHREDQRANPMRRLRLRRGRALVHFLAADASSYITGQVWGVTAEWTCDAPHSVPRRCEHRRAHAAGQTVRGPLITSSMPRPGRWPYRTRSAVYFTPGGVSGSSGSFLWVDPEASIACARLTDRDSGPWGADQVQVPRLSQLTTIERRARAESTSEADNPADRARTASRAPRGSWAWMASSRRATSSALPARSPHSSCAAHRSAVTARSSALVAAGNPEVLTGCDCTVQSRRPSPATRSHHRQTGPPPGRDLRLRPSWLRQRAARLPRGEVRFPQGMSHHSSWARSADMAAGSTPS